MLGVKNVFAICFYFLSLVFLTVLSVLVKGHFFHVLHSLFRGLARRFAHKVGVVDRLLGFKHVVVLLLSLFQRGGNVILLVLARPDRIEVEQRAHSLDVLRLAAADLAVDQVVKVAVGNLLEGIELSQFCSINMDAMPELNDLLGGVTVTMPDDYPDLDPAYVKGARITLTGRQAYDFVHDRMTVGDGTNLSRMKRQRAYMEAVQDILQKRGKYGY